MADKTESNPRGAGRKATGVQRVSMNISGTKEQLDKLRELACLERKTVSRFILEQTGVINMNENKWFVTNDNGDVAGHDLSEMKAKLLAEELNSKFFYFSTVDSDFMVDYENEPTTNLDNVMKFNTREEAEEEIEKIQSSWKTKLRICEYQDDSNWEALNGADED